MSTGISTISAQTVVMSDGSTILLGSTTQGVTYTPAGSPPPPPPPPPPPGGISAPVALFSPATGINSGTAHSTTVDAPAGTLIVVFVYAWTNANTGFSGTVTDSAGNTYTKAVDVGAVGANYYNCGIYYCLNPVHLASGGTITAAVQTGAQIAIGAYKVPGIGSGGALDKTASAHTTASSISVATGTLSTANEIVLGCFNPNGYPTFTEGSGFTSLYGTTFVNANGPDAAYDIVSATTSVSYAPSAGASTQICGAVATFHA